MSKSKQILKLVPPSIYSTPCLDTEELEISFFRGQLEKLRQPHPHKDEQKIIDYLTAGHGSAIVFGVMHDPFTNEFMGYPNPLSDGEWWWEQSLPNYVKKYHLSLPEEFIVHMKNNNWEVMDASLIDFASLDYIYPVLSDEDIESLDLLDMTYEVWDYEFSNNCKRITKINPDNSIQLNRGEYKEYLRIKREYLLTALSKNEQ